MQLAAAPRAFQALCQKLGIVESYVDASGATVDTSVETALAIMRCMGLELTSPDDAAVWPWPQSRTWVAWDGKLDATLFEDGLAAHDQETGAEFALTADTCLPRGYYDITLNGRAHAWLISAPRVAYSTDTVLWSLFSPLFALRDINASGGPTTRTFREFVEIAAQWGAGAVATLPLLAGYASGEASPYEPSSKRYWNEWYLDLEAVAAFRENQVAQAKYHEPSFVAAGKQLASDPHIDYAAWQAHKQSILQPLGEDCNVPPSDYAVFRAKQASHGLDWTTWPADHKAPDSLARYYQFLQQENARQWNEVSRFCTSIGVKLLLDLPVGVHARGFDVFEFPTLFATGASVGAPPDELQPAGQNWGLAPINPHVSQANHYQYFRQCLTHHMATADILRIDHVMGLERVFWIPDDAASGAYVRSNAEAMYAIVCLESHRHRCSVVGEDLGTVPQSVRDNMRRHELLGTSIASPASRVPTKTMAALGTHDMTPFVQRVGAWDDGNATRPEQVRNRVLRQMKRSRPAILQVDVVDLLLVDLAHNHPGTTSAEAPNWRCRHQRPLSSLAEDKVVQSALAVLTETATDDD